MESDLKRLNDEILELQDKEKYGNQFDETNIKQNESSNKNVIVGDQLFTKI